MPLLTRDEASREAQRNLYAGLQGMISKAVIPIAGLGTRVRPYAVAVPKAMFALVRGQRLRPVIHWILADVRAAAMGVRPQRGPRPAELDSGQRSPADGHKRRAP